MFTFSAEQRTVLEGLKAASRPPETGDELDLSQIPGEVPFWIQLGSAGLVGGLSGWCAERR
jgi:hypothetical protein